MKTIFKAITAQLQTVTELKWIDKDKGQMNFERPPVLFPAALITITVPTSQNITRIQQAGTAKIDVKLCFDYGGNTSAVTPTVDRDRSLAYYDVVDKVYAALQGFGTAEINPLERRSFSPIARPDTYVTEVMVFTGDFLEEPSV